MFSQVLFIDYGDTCECNCSDIRRDIMFTDVPTLSYKFRLLNIEPNTESGQWSPEAVNFAIKNFLESPCRVRICEGEPLETVSPCVLKTSDGKDLATLLLTNKFARRKKPSRIASMENLAQCMTKEMKTEKPKQNNDWAAGPRNDLNDFKNMFERYNMLQEANGHRMNYGRYEGKIIEEKAQDIDMEFPDELKMLPVSTSTSIGSDLDAAVDSEVLKVKRFFRLLPTDKRSQPVFKCQFMSCIDVLRLALAPVYSDYDEKFDKILQKIQTQPMGQGRMLALAQDKTCIALSTEKNLWMRGIIQSVSAAQTHASVLFVDSLATETVAKINIYEIEDKEIADFPVRYSEVKIHGLKPTHSTSSHELFDVLQEHMATIQKKMYAKIVQTDGNECEVELYSTRRLEHDIFQRLIDEGYYAKTYFMPQ